MVRSRVPNKQARQRIAARSHGVALFLTYFGLVPLVIAVHSPPITSDVAKPNTANSAANSLLMIVKG
jgi:hypothetical protein